MAQQPVDAPTPEQVDIPEGTMANGEPVIEHSKNVIRKKRQRETAVY